MNLVDVAKMIHLQRKIQSIDMVVGIIYEPGMTAIILELAVNKKEGKLACKPGSVQPNLAVGNHSSGVRVTTNF